MIGGWVKMIGWIITIAGGVVIGWYLKGKLSKKSDKVNSDEE